jgi:hypothetical protein
MEEIVEFDTFTSKVVTTNLDWIRLQFAQGESFRYKLCKHHIVQLQIKGNYKFKYISNETRTVIDHRFAKYRSNYMYVNAILDMNTQKMKNEITHTWNHQTIITYKVGTFVYPDSFDPIEKGVCGHGIHFFKTLEGAYFYDWTAFNEQSDISFDDDGEVTAMRESYFNYETDWNQMRTFFENKYHLYHLHYDVARNPFLKKASFSYPI